VSVALPDMLKIPAKATPGIDDINKAKARMNTFFNNINLFY